MSKVNINYKIESGANQTVTKKTNGIMKDNKLFFIDENCNMQVSFSVDNITILRDSSEYSLELNFKQDKTLPGKYLLKEHNMIIDTKVNTIKLVIDDKKLFAIYKLYFDEELADTFTFELEWSE